MDLGSSSAVSSLTMLSSEVDRVFSLSTPRSPSGRYGTICFASMNGNWPDWTPLNRCPNSVSDPWSCSGGLFPAFLAAYASSRPFLLNVSRIARAAAALAGSAKILDLLATRKRASSMACASRMTALCAVFWSNPCTPSLMP
eukprot:3113321-Amphidinium_carterae.4